MNAYGAFRESQPSKGIAVLAVLGTFGNDYASNHLVALGESIMTYGGCSMAGGSGDLKGWLHYRWSGLEGGIRAGGALSRGR